MNAPQHLRALEQGRYSRWLPRYYETLGRSRVHVIFQEELRAEPRRVLQEICKTMKIAPTFYVDYDFKRFNRTANVKSSTLHRFYMRLRYHVQRRTHNKRFVHGMLRRLRLLFEPVYYRLNAAERQIQVEIPREWRYRLFDYYANEPDTLARLIGRRPPWDLARILQEPGSAASRESP